ncbi:flavin monoamine oxidase family protein [Zobellia sp. B3R18]|uniref:flavin monoamine oxidase family protein n=1 Tax=Zobellia sp. B3R18 TaxID=2841568 RepID=UPI001C0744F6|nr:NAD(P)/FAD-dependent oxidoreductase [Zobellia sp. B3R18]MBU2975414.1 FAD-dependent oxidoreductase [Zobellia sp. B3R18]
MKENFSKYIIIGAGLSGLTSAYKLFGKGVSGFRVLESRDRIGGRILTQNGIDFGATWFQTHHEAVIELLNELGIEKYHQYNKGKSVLVYSTMAPEHYFENDPNTPAAYRIKGNSQALIQALAKPVLDKIQTNTNVLSISETEDGVRVETNKGVFYGEKVIVTIPPKIATRISFSPELPVEVGAVMDKTHTWMSNAIKVGLTFKEPFWRNKNFSGMVIGQVGAVTELYDHNDAENSHFALMGFVNEGLRDTSEENRKQRILDYLSKYLGAEVLNYLTYEEKDWSKDRHTSCETIKSIYMSPSYGNPVFTKSYLNGKLWFSGAETSLVHGGYMDGAIISGINAAQKIMG